MYLEIEIKRAMEEAENSDRMKRKVEAEGRRLLEVKAAERAAFWYTANFEGFAGFELCCSPPSIDFRVIVNPLYRVLGLKFLNWGRGFADKK